MCSYLNDVTILNKSITSTRRPVFCPSYQLTKMSLAEYESPILTRQLSWESDSYSEFSHQSTDSRGSSESINDQIEEVTSDLNDMLKEVEVM